MIIYRREDESLRSETGQNAIRHVVAISAEKQSLTLSTLFLWKQDAQSLDFLATLVDFFALTITSLEMQTLPRVSKR